MRKFTTKAHVVCTSFLIVGLLMLSFQMHIQAATVIWEGTLSTDWFTDGNWDSGTTPGAMDNVIIPAGTPFSPELDGQAKVMSVRLFPNASFLITADGELIIEGTVGGFLNSGKFEIDGVLRIVNSRDGLLNRGDVSNHGEIKMMNIVRLGIVNKAANGILVNAGSINLNNIGDQGIDNTSNGHIFNEETGSITISNTGSDGLMNRKQALFENYGELLIQATIAGNGIFNRNEGEFINGSTGELTVSGTDLSGVLNRDEGSSIHNYGWIAIKDDLGKGALVNLNASEWINKPCSELYVEDYIRNQSYILNEGFLQNDHTGIHVNVGSFINEGVIVDIPETLQAIPLDNNEMIFTSLFFDADDLMDPAIQGVAPFDLTLTDEAIFTDDQLLQAGANFYWQDNIFENVSGQPAGLYDWYVEVNDTTNACSYQFKIPGTISVDPPPAFYLYYTEQDQQKISVYDYYNNDQADVVTTDLELPFDVEIDAEFGKMFWSDQGVNKIFSANLDGSGIQTLADLGDAIPLGIDLDPRAQLVYFASINNNQMNGSEKIQAVSYDGLDLFDVLNEDIEQPTKVAVDTASNRIFWVDAGKNLLMEATLDGTDLDTFYNPGFTTNILYEVEVDPKKEVLYYTAIGGGAGTSIYRSKTTSFDSEFVTEVASLIVPDVEIDSASTGVFWTDPENFRIQYASLATMDEGEIITDPDSPFGLALLGMPDLDDMAFANYRSASESEHLPRIGANLQIFPNPTTGSFTLQGLDADKDYEVLLFDSKGVLKAYTRVRQQATFEDHIGSLPAGFYFLRLQSGEEIQTIRFVKE